VKRLTAAQRFALAEAGRAFSDASWQMVIASTALSHHRDLQHEFTPNIDPDNPGDSWDLTAIQEMLNNLGNCLTSRALSE